MTKELYMMAEVQSPTSGESKSTEPRLTVETLKQIMKEIIPEGSDKFKKKYKPVPAGAAPSVWFINRDFNVIGSVDPYNEVYPGIILSDQALAFQKDELRKLGVTHILNAAQGTKFNQIDTAAAYYADLNLEFLGINAMDIFTYKLSKHFTPAAEFIHKALSSKGKVMVHCKQGVSRSATLVLVYLMTYQNMTLTEALTTVRHKRAIMPNDGFLKQLIECHYNRKVSSGTEDKSEEHTN